MTADPFSEAARAEAERRWSRDQANGRPLSAYARMNRRIGFDLGALWARTHLAQQNPLTEAIRAVAATTTLTGQDVAGIAQSLQHITQKPTAAEVDAGMTAAAQSMPAAWWGGTEWRRYVEEILSAARNAGRAER